MSEGEAIQETGSQEAAAPAVNFIDTLPEDIRAEPSLKNFSDIGGLAKSYVHAQRLIGADKVPIPGKSATDEDWDMIYSRLGRPTDANGYDIKMPEGFKDGDTERFKEVAFKAGLNGKQASAIADMLEGQLTEVSESYNTNAENLRHDAEMELRKEWGKAFEQKMHQANRGAEYFADGDVLDIQLADGRKVGDHPQLIRMFASLAERIAEDNVEGKAQDAIMTPVEANRELAELQAKDSPYWDKTHPQHESFVQRAQQLFELMEE
mgnify:CR=1 FL=1